MYEPTSGTQSGTIPAQHPTHAPIAQTPAANRSHALEELRRRGSASCTPPADETWNAVRTPWVVNVQQHPMAVLEVQRRTAWVGSNPDPTVVGMTITGGINSFGRRYGLGADSIVTVELVDGLGRLRMVSATEDPELFWAVRGGGDDFGIFTRMELRTAFRPPGCTTVNDGDMPAQAMDNVETVLAAAGMTLADVVRYDVQATGLPVYFMNGGHEQVARRFGHVGTFPAGGIAAQVPALAVPGMAVEITVIAAR